MPEAIGHSRAVPRFRTGTGEGQLGPDADRSAVLFGALIALSVCAAYSNTLGAPFVLDDSIAILHNPSIRNLWNLGAVLTPASSLSTGRRPVLNLSFAINHALGGTGVWGYHAVNIIVHVFAALTLFGLVRRSLRLPAWSARFGSASTGIAACVAALWALHPLLTESVTYVSQRAESLAGLFSLFTLYALVRSETSAHGRLWLAGSGLACFLGMSTKEVAVTLPLVAFLFDRAFLNGSLRAVLSRRPAYYAALASSWLWLAYLMVHFGFVDSGVGIASGASSFRYLWTEAMVVARYLRLVVWPSPLVFDYGPELAADGFIQALPFVAVVAAGAAAAVLLWRRSPALGFLASSFFIMLAPTSSFVPVQGQPMAESRMYLPAAALLALGALPLYYRFRAKALGCMMGGVALLALLTFQRNRAYASDVGIWEDSLAKCPVNSRGHNNLAVALANDPSRVPRALAEFEEALRISPGYAEARCNYGATLFKLPGRQHEAIAQFEEALRANPGYAAAHNNLGTALGDEGRTAEAIQQYRDALRTDPRFAIAHDNLGNALAKDPGKAYEAVGEYREALRLEPDFPDAMYNLANLLATAPGRAPEAISLYEKALALNPNMPIAHVNLANVLSGLPGRATEAIGHYEAAVRLRPDFAEAHFDLANMYSIQPGRMAEAVRHYLTALRLKPDYAYAHYRLGNALAASGRLAEAENHYRAALRLMPELPEAHNGLANVLVLANRTEEAKREYETVLHINPNFESARKILAMLNNGERG
jgi:tetratricopeptide (TPR) repeat protein